MKKITIEDVLELKEKFDKYLITAEQHEIIILAMIDLKLNNTIKTIQSNNYPLIFAVRSNKIEELQKSQSGAAFFELAK